MEIVKIRGGVVLELADGTFIKAEPSAEGVSLSVCLSQVQRNELSLGILRVLSEGDAASKYALCMYIYGAHMHSYQFEGLLEVLEEMGADGRIVQRQGLYGLPPSTKDTP